ncbi:ABC transporter permease, partial [Rhodothermus sp. AH-315-K08]|nr:ABC transporter permease [Rhodothermus sp. AH-315-K08]
SVGPYSQNPASLARGALRRQNPRQEPSAVVPLAGICAGGRLERAVPTATYGFGDGYMEVIGLERLSGRFFSEDYPGDRENVVVVNQTFVDQAGWSDPLNRTVRIDGTERSVVGVAKNFQMFLAVTEYPAVFLRSSTEDDRYVWASVAEHRPEEKGDQYQKGSWCDGAPPGHARESQFCGDANSGWRYRNRRHRHWN